MCGRFVVANVGSELVGVLRVDVESDDLPEPSYNIAPTNRVAIVLDSIKPKAADSAAGDRAVGSRPRVGEGHQDRRPGVQRPF